VSSRPLAKYFLRGRHKYGDNQYTSRMKGPVDRRAKTSLIHCKGTMVNTKVVGAGPRFDAIHQGDMIFSRTIKLVGRSNPPIVVVDGPLASGNSLYDILE